MDSRKTVIKETAIVAAGEVILSAAMVGVFAALGFFKMNVLWSALAGCAVIISNHFFLAITVSLAADRAARGEVEQAQKMIRLSSVGRFLTMAVVLVLGIWMGANVLALCLPLVFHRPILMVGEFFRKKEDA